MRFVLLSTLLGLTVYAQSASAAPVRIHMLRVQGAPAAPLRRLLLGRLGRGPGCATVGQRLRLSARIAKSGHVTLSHVHPLTVRSCLRRKLGRFPRQRQSSVLSVNFAWRLPTAAERRAARRRAALSAKLTKIGLLKLLGSRGGATLGAFRGSTLSSGRPFSGFRGSTLSSSRRFSGFRVGTLRSKGMGGGGVGWGYAATRRRARRLANVKLRKQALKQALRLPRWRGKPAPWWQAEPSGYGWWRPGYAPVALGPDLAIVAVTVKHQARRAKQASRQTHYVALDRQRILGIVRFPKAPAWAGIDAQKHIYFVDQGGQLHGATLAQALAGAFAQRAKVPAGRWEASGSRLAVLAKERLRLSTDGGRHFTAITAPKALGTAKAQDFALRPDGLLAVIFETATGTRTLQLSRDDGRSWTASAFQPPTIARIGGLISADHGCGRAVLAADGKRWIATSLPNARGWAGSLRERGRYVYGGFASDATPPPQVTGSSRVITAAKPVRCRGSGGLVGAGVGGLGFSGATGCHRYGARARCLRGSTGHRQARSFLSAYRLRLAPTVAFVDHRTGALTFGSLPKTCARPRLELVPGSTLLFCARGGAKAPLADEQTELFFATSKGTWLRDGVLPARAAELRPVAAAEDGTLLLQACDYDRQRQRKEGNGYLCSRAWVRKPAPFGAPKAWREVRRTDMLAYRPLPGGRALLIDRANDKLDAIQLSIETSKQIRAFGPPIPLTRDYGNLTVVDRTIRLHDRGSRFILLPQGKITSFPTD